MSAPAAQWQQQGLPMQQQQQQLLVRVLQVHPVVGWVGPLPLLLLLLLLGWALVQTIPSKLSSS
jgi:hypothetical protein